MLSSDKEDDDSSICAVGFSSSPEPTSPLSAIMGRTKDSSPLAIGFSDSEKSSPAITLQTIGMKINKKLTITIV